MLNEWNMSRPSKKHSSGFHEDFTSKMKLPKSKYQQNGLSSNNLRVTNGESSTAPNSWHNQNGHHTVASLSSSIPSQDNCDVDVVIVDDSDEENDLSYDNNNEESSPDRHRYVDTEENLRDSNETERNNDSEDDNEPVDVDKYVMMDDLEQLSQIVSDSKL